MSLGDDVMRHIAEVLSREARFMAPVDTGRYYRDTPLPPRRVVAHVGRPVPAIDPAAVLDFAAQVGQPLTDWQSHVVRHVFGEPPDVIDGEIV